MDEFKARQLAQMRFGITDFREGRISLGALLSRLEGAARAIGQEFWEQEVFETSLDLEQINADLVDECRALSPVEHAQVALLLDKLAAQLGFGDLHEGLKG